MDIEKEQKFNGKRRYLLIPASRRNVEHTGVFYILKGKAANSCICHRHFVYSLYGLLLYDFGCILLSR